MVIKVDGFKVVIIEPKPTPKEFRERLLWSAYKVKMGLHDWTWKDRKAA